MIAPGSYLTVTGSGCVADSSVTVLATASHATGTTIGRGTANAGGRFSLRVKMPFKGEPRAAIVAVCRGADQNTIIAAQIPVGYTSA
jgi:hypothetical protein